MTSLKYLENISRIKNVNIYSKNDVFYPKYMGGSKARKVERVIRNALENKIDVLVTAGSESSNHARVVAIAALENGMKSHIVIHGKENNGEVNLQLMRAAGANIEYCEIYEVKGRMNDAVQMYKDRGINPLYIWGGGHNIEGGIAFIEAVTELKEQINGKFIPDYIFVQSGTGSTQGGLIVGCCEHYPDCKVVGISVARNSIRGMNEVKVFTDRLANSMEKKSVPEDKIIFDDSYLFGGYGGSSKKLKEIIKMGFNCDGLILDECYTAKAFLGLIDYIDNGAIEKGSCVVFWNTGGVFNKRAVI